MVCGASRVEHLPCVVEAMNLIPGTARHTIEMPAYMIIITTQGTMQQ